jgi:uncharacterized membrane protein
MSTLTSNKNENRYALFHKDGLLDVFIGFGIFFAGLFLWTEMVWMAAIFVPIFLPAFQAARNRFLHPRLGNLDHDPRFQAQAQKILFSVTLLLGILLLAGVGMFFAFGEMSGPVNDWLRQYFLLVIGFIFAGVWVFAAALLKIVRFYLYAVFTLVSLGAAQITTLPFWLALSILGGLIALVGSLFLIRFVQQYPNLE